MPKAKSIPASQTLPAKPDEVVPYLERAMERRAEMVLARQEAEQEEADKRAAERTAALKAAPQNPILPKITAANMLEAHAHHMKIAREHRLKELAREHPEIADAIQN